MPFEEISLHYRGTSPVNRANRKYLCWQGQHCRAVEWTFNQQLNPTGMCIPLPSSSPRCRTCSTHLLQAALTYTQGAAPSASQTYPNSKVEASAPIEYISRASGPWRYCQHGGLWCTSTWHHENVSVLVPGSKLGRQQECSTAAVLVLVFRFQTICMAWPVLGWVFLAPAGEVPPQRSAASQSWLAQGRASQNALCSNREAAERCSSQKSAALVLF